MRKLLLFIFISFYTLACTDGPTKITKERAFIASQDFVLDKLNNPKTSEFEYSTYSYDAITKKKGIILAKFTASNSYGVPKEYVYKMYLQFLGKDWMEQKNWKCDYLTIEDVASRKISYFGTKPLYLPESTDNNTVAEEQKLEIAIDNAQKSDEIETEIFLDFRFGMTEKEVQNHYLKLLKSKKIYKNTSGIYQYDLNLENSFVIHLTFKPQYYEGELYEMIFPTTYAKTGNSAGCIFAVSAFTDSGKNKDFDCYDTVDYDGEEEYIYIKDNLIISFSDFITSRMTYSNAPILKKISDIKSQITQEKVNETLSDF